MLLYATKYKKPDFKTEEDKRFFDNRIALFTKASKLNSHYKDYMKCYHELFQVPNKNLSEKISTTTHDKDHRDKKFGKTEIKNLLKNEQKALSNRNNKFR
jgi:hypothetical protein